MSFRPKAPETTAKHSRLDVVLRAGLRTGAFVSVGAGTDTDKSALLTSQILGVLNMDSQVLMSVRGLLRLLQLCQVTGRLSDFLNCNNQNAWRELLRISSERVTDWSEGWSEGVLKSVDDVDAEVGDLYGPDDRLAANMYKQEFTKHVLYSALYDEVRAPNIDDVRFSLIWFTAQIVTFLSRKNGSKTNIVKEIKNDMKRIRRRDPDFPPVPSSFYVGAVKLVAEVNRQSAAGRDNLPDLYSFIQATDFY